MFGKTTIFLFFIFYFLEAKKLRMYLLFFGLFINYFFVVNFKNAYYLTFNSACICTLCHFILFTVDPKP